MPGKLGGESVEVLILTVYFLLLHLSSASDFQCNGNTEFCTLKFDQFSFAGSHSAAVGPTRGCNGDILNTCIYSNQGINITAQLDLGIRYLSLEVCALADDCNTDAYNTLDNSRLVSCKGNDEDTAFIEFGYRESLIEILQQVDAWLLSNPNEVIGVHFTRGIPEADWDPVFSGLVPLLERMWGDGSPNTSATRMNTYKSTHTTWPTLREAIEADERIFVFVDDELSLNGSVHPTWISPTPFSMPSLVNRWDSSCNSPGVISHADLCNGTDEEELVVAIGYTLGICIFNGQAACSGQLQNATDKCLEFRGYRTVNILLVDFPDSSGSNVFEIVANLNQKNIERFILLDIVTTDSFGNTSAALPGKPRDLMAESVTSQGLTLTWVEPNGNTIQGYLVMYMELEFMIGEQERVVNISEHVEMADITGLAPGVYYTFTVTAYNERGESAPSNPLTVRTQDGGTITNATIPVITCTLAILIIVIITILVIIVVYIKKRKKSVNLQANPVDSNINALVLYDIVSDKTDEHMYEDIGLTRTHYEVSDNIGLYETCEPQEMDNTKGKDTYNQVPNVDIAQLMDESKGKDTYKRVPNEDVARLMDESKGKDTYERVPNVDVARLIDESKGN